MKFLLEQLQPLPHSPDLSKQKKVMQYIFVVKINVFIIQYHAKNVFIIMYFAVAMLAQVVSQAQLGPRPTSLSSDGEGEEKGEKGEDGDKDGG